MGVFDCFFGYYIIATKKETLFNSTVLWCLLYIAKKKYVHVLVEPAGLLALFSEHCMALKGDWKLHFNEPCCEVVPPKCSYY